jgi:GNAT superfamily N-acetyltransferase
MSPGYAPDPSQPGTKPAVTLRPMTRHDIAFVTTAHRTFFPDNVMGRLGGPFLRRYYTTFLGTPYAVATMAETAGHPCGYLVGIFDTGAHRKLLLRSHGGSMVAAALLGLLLHPRFASALLVRRVRLLFQRWRQRSESRGTASVPASVAVLSHVATVQAVRGSGVGSVLVSSFEASCREYGADRVSLATLDGPEGAGPFYVRQGWHLKARRQTFDGRWIRLYDRELHNDA